MAKEATNQPRFINATIAAKEYGFPRSTILGWTYRKKCPFYKLGRSVVFKRTDFEDFLERNRQEAWDGG